MEGHQLARARVCSLSDWLLLSNVVVCRLERVRFELFSPEFELRSLVDGAEAAAKAKDPLAALTLLAEADGVAANMPNGEAVHKERCRALALKVRVSGRLPISIFRYTVITAFISRRVGHAQPSRAGGAAARPAQLVRAREACPPCSIPSIGRSC